jgi:hypothetical protein
LHLPQYIRLVLDHSVLVSGLLVLPVTAPMVLISPFAGRLSARVAMNSAAREGHTDQHGVMMDRS